MTRGVVDDTSRTAVFSLNTSCACYTAKVDHPKQAIESLDMDGGILSAWITLEAKISAMDRERSGPCESTRLLCSDRYR